MDGDRKKWYEQEASKEGLEGVGDGDGGVAGDLVEESKGPKGQDDLEGKSHQVQEDTNKVDPKVSMTDPSIRKELSYAQVVRGSVVPPLVTSFNL